MKKVNTSKELRVSGLFGKNPIIGFWMFVIGGLTFFAMAYNLVKQGPLIKWDLFIAEWFHILALKSPAYVIDIMIAGYYAGTGIIIASGVILGLYFLYKRFWREFTMVVIAFGGSGLLFLALSRIFMRPRPFLLFDEMIWAGSPNIPGFPSGHVKSILVCCGFLIYLFWPKIKSKFGKFLAVSGGLILVAYIGFSRLFLGDHFMTDIIAGYAVGTAWLGLICTSIEWLFKKYQKKEGGKFHGQK